MHRSTVAKGIYELVDNDVIWLVEESERRGMKRIKQHSRKRKHILLVGLGKLLSDHYAWGAFSYFCAYVYWALKI